MNKDLIIEIAVDEGTMAYYKNDVSVVAEVRHTQKIFEHSLIFSELYDIIKKSKVVIDGGSHAGSHTILYKHINPSLEVHCFEPQLKLFELLQYNISQNSIENVYLYNLALANKVADVTMTTRVTQPPDTPDTPEKIYDRISYGGEELFNLGGIGIGDGGEAVKTTYIDLLDLPSCDFIKLDLEGAEPIALLGAIQTINKFRPAILFEYNFQQLDDSWYDFFEVPKLTPFEILNANGYEIRGVGIDNYLAIHRSGLVG